MCNDNQRRLYFSSKITCVVPFSNVTLPFVSSHCARRGKFSSHYKSFAAYFSSAGNKWLILPRRRISGIRLDAFSVTSYVKLRHVLCSGGFSMKGGTKTSVNPPFKFTESCPLKQQFSLNRESIASMHGYP